MVRVARPGQYLQSAGSGVAHRDSDDVTRIEPPWTLMREGAVEGCWRARWRQLVGGWSVTEALAAGGRWCV